jgi:hypothetical protein
MRPSTPVEHATLVRAAARKELQNVQVVGNASQFERDPGNALSASVPSRRMLKTEGNIGPAPLARLKTLART